MVLVAMLLSCSFLTTPGPGQALWRWPLSPIPQVIRGFQAPALPWGPGHRGVDLAARPAQPVYAAGPGRVSYAGELAGRGVITIVHGPLRTTYLPVRPVVRVGDRVSAGTRIGTVQTRPGHCGAAMCLHWGLLHGGTYLDPLTLVRPRLRLFPVWTDPLQRPYGPAPPSYASVPPARASQPDDPQGQPPDNGSNRPLSARQQDNSRGRPPDNVPRVPPTEPLRTTLRASATTAATGGVLAGLALAFPLALLWRRFPIRRRLPPNVIDLTRERHRRRPPA